MVRHDRAKRAKKTMKFFKMNYGVKPPYFVLSTCLPPLEQINLICCGIK
jgi:hypothetical protein